MASHLHSIDFLLHLLAQVCHLNLVKLVAFSTARCLMSVSCSRDHLAHNNGAANLLHHLLLLLRLTDDRVLTGRSLKSLQLLLGLLMELVSGRLPYVCWIILAFHLLLYDPLFNPVIPVAFKTFSVLFKKVLCLLSLVKHQFGKL